MPQLCCVGITLKRYAEMIPEGAAKEWAASSIGIEVRKIWDGLATCGGLLTRLPKLPNGQGPCKGDGSILATALE